MIEADRIISGQAKIDEDYQKVLEKANQGKELSDDDVKKIEAYQNRYGRELPDTITKAVAQFVFKKTKVAARGNSENDIKKLYKNILPFCVQYICGFPSGVPSLLTKAFVFVCVYP